MSDDVAVVWASEGSARDEAALAEWARARGIRLVVPSDRAPALRVDLAIGDDVEKELDRAREAIAAADADTAERALARAETRIREHPELPHAAWLRAEVERAWSARWLRIEPRNEARARTAWENAEALDGGRAFGIGEVSFPPRGKVKTTIRIAGGSRSVTLRLDGVALSTNEVEVAPAEHHLTVTDDGRLLFAGWIAIAGPAPAPITLTLADGGACGRDELSGARREGGRIVARGVTCASWVAAVPADRPGSILVARCEREVCGPLLEWRMEGVSPSGPPQPRPKLVGWPAWATWALVGIGTATATSVALVATGVFEQRPVEPRFVVGGARQE